MGHIAARCYNRFNENFQTADLESAIQVSLLTHNYSGSYAIMKGGVSYLPIESVGKVVLNTQNEPSELNNVLHVPAIKKKLLSISQFTDEKDCIFEFNSNGFTIINRPTRRVVVGSKKGSLYVLDQVKEAAFFSNRQTKATQSILHNRLGHCSLRTIQQLKKQGMIELLSENKDADMCVSCKMANSHNCHLWKNLHVLLNLLRGLVVIYMGASTFSICKKFSLLCCLC